MDDSMLRGDDGSTKRKRIGLMAEVFKNGYHTRTKSRNNHTKRKYCIHLERSIDQIT